MRKLVVLGSYSFGEEVADLAAACGYQVMAFVENRDQTRCEQTVLGCPVVWIDDSTSYVAECEAVCSIYSTKRTSFITQAEALGFSFATLIHPTAHVSPSSTIGPGSIVSAGVIVASHTHIGAHVIVNRGVLVGHHTQIDDYVTISPGANIAGKITIGKCAYIGMSAIVIDKRSIGEYSVVGSGAVVVKDVPPRVQVLGIPARITKETIEGQ